MRTCRNNFGVRVARGTAPTMDVRGGVDQVGVIPVPPSFPRGPKSSQVMSHPNQGQSPCSCSAVIRVTVFVRLDLDLDFVGFRREHGRLEAFGRAFALTQRGVQDSLALGESV
jgi:hypothetical protein